MSNETKINKNSYSKRTLSTFSLISSYVVDVYYNHLYNEAKKARDEGKTTSIAEGYRMCCLIFAKSLDDKSPKYRKKQYYKIIEGIKEFFTLYTSMSTLTISECIHKIVSELVPDKYLNDLDNDKKSVIVHKCLVDSITEFTKIAVCDYITHIVDSHDDPANVEALKDQMTDILLLEREKSLQLFLVGSKQPMVDRGLAIKLQNDIKSLSAQNKDLHTRLTQEKHQNEVLLSNFNNLMEKTKTAYKRYNSLKAEHEALKDKLSIYERKEDEYKSADKESDTYSEVDEEPEDPLQEFLTKSRDKFIKNNKHKYGGKQEQDMPYTNGASNDHSNNHANNHSNNNIDTNNSSNSITLVNNAPITDNVDAHDNQHLTNTSLVEFNSNLVESTDKKPIEKKKEPRKRKVQEAKTEDLQPKTDPVEDRFKTVSKPALKRKLGNNPGISDIYS